jgi:hypothetical protein
MISEDIDNHRLNIINPYLNPWFRTLQLGVSLVEFFIMSV